ncbi:isoamyl acetate-hydrolyzing esterase [Meyerozyma guilliermondii]
MLNYDKIVLFGDSITEFSFNSSKGFGFGSQLASDYTLKLDVLNRGVSGYNSNNLSYVLPEVLAAEHVPGKSVVKLLTIFIGTNDALDTIQAVSLDKYRANIKAMTSMALEKGIKVILIGPTLHDQAANKRVFQDGTIASSAKNRKYSQAVESVAQELNVPFIDLWSAFVREGGFEEEKILDNSVSCEEFLPDGIHFSPAAYRVLYNEIINCISSNYPEMKSEALQRKLREWRDVDGDNIQRSVFRLD